MYCGGLAAYGSAKEKPKPTPAARLPWRAQTGLKILRPVQEPGTLAMYSAGLSGPSKEKPKPDAKGETTLPYYGKRKLD
jgi:hypothetical protein